MAETTEPSEIIKLLELGGYKTYEVDVSPLLYYFISRYGMEEVDIKPDVSFKNRIKRKLFEQYLFKLVEQQKAEFQSRNKMKIYYDSMHGTVVEKRG